MSEHEVLNALRDSLDDITMSTPVERIEAAGSTRRNRRRLVGTAGVAAAAALAIGVPALSNPPTAPPSAGDSTGAGSVHIQTAAYTVDTKKDGTLVVTWDKAAYFSDHAGLEKALRKAGFPVLIREGVFCKGPHDDGKLSPSGSGPGVTSVMKGGKDHDGRVTLTFVPAAMPAGKQLFIGYLNAAQLASVHMNPGSVERIVPAVGPLTCTSTPPPEHHYN
ncbi:hypothetical protein [Actinacidiphila acididurans]|uniref:Tat pathway signal sequence domain protein n=1 Tax=Actinacidiphila acididurans TaxID=2784346 RepID=A0ABS2THZ9_9ACTN|nr:hypothetical protein [Actinacidiphila acididurans]MBM9502964.1 hypothetical protein [Actinacidiphila acididurans]